MDLGMTCVVGMRFIQFYFFLSHSFDQWTHAHATKCCLQLWAKSINLCIMYRLHGMDQQRPLQPFPQGGDLDNYAKMASRRWSTMNSYGPDPSLPMSSASAMSPMLPNMPTNLTSAETQALLQALHQKHQVSICLLTDTFVACVPFLNAWLCFMLCQIDIASEQEDQCLWCSFSSFS